MKNAELEYLGLKITKNVKDQINQRILEGEYATQSELVRAAIKQLLDKEVQ